MGITKHGIGEVIPDKDDDQGVRKEASKTWTEADAKELAEENED